MGRRKGVLVRFGRAMALGMGVLLGAVGCTDDNENIGCLPAPTSIVQWFEPDIRPEAYGVQLNFQLGYAEGRLTVHVDIYNGGDLPVAYRADFDNRPYYDISDSMRCNRMMISDGRLDILQEPFEDVYVGGYAGFRYPEVTVIQPGDTAQLDWWVVPADACSDIRQELLEQRPPQWRFCLGFLQLSSEYALGGSRWVDTGGSITGGGRNLVLLCSPSADLPAEWYAG